MLHQQINYWAIKGHNWLWNRGHHISAFSPQLPQDSTTWSSSTPRSQRDHGPLLGSVFVPSSLNPPSSSSSSDHFPEEDHCSLPSFYVWRRHLEKQAILLRLLASHSIIPSVTLAPLPSLRCLLLHLFLPPQPQTPSTFLSAAKQNISYRPPLSVLSCRSTFFCFLLHYLCSLNYVPSTGWCGLTSS